jgi:hypothetical protein
MTPERLEELKKFSEFAGKDLINAIFNYNLSPEQLDIIRTALPELIAEVERLKGILKQFAGEELRGPHPYEETP